MALMSTTLYKDDLAKLIAPQIGKPATKAKRLIKVFEEIIAGELKSKDRVKLQNFGTFYLIHQQSRHIIQIRTKQRRILVGTTIIKFRPSVKVKKRINGRNEEEILKIIQSPAVGPITVDIDKPQPQIAPVQQVDLATDKQEGENIPIAKPDNKKVEIKVETGSNETESAPAAPKTYERVDTEKVRAEILRRIQGVKIDETKSDEILFSHHILETTGAGRLIESALKRVVRLGSLSLNFYILASSPSCNIFFGKPRKRLAQIPKASALEFLSKHLEIENTEFPQERFVKLYSNSKMDSGWVIFAHVLPLAEGASIYIRIVKQI